MMVWHPQQVAPEDNNTAMHSLNVNDISTHDREMSPRAFMFPAGIRPYHFNRPIYIRDKRYHTIVDM
jgi:hypothetical protein